MITITKICIKVYSIWVRVRIGQIFIVETELHASKIVEYPQIKGNGLTAINTYNLIV